MQNVPNSLVGMLECVWRGGRYRGGPGTSCWSLPLVRRGSFNNIPTRFLLRKCAIVSTKYSLASSQTHTAQHLLFSHMIIPIKCFTCGNVLADKFRYFQEKVRQRKIKDDKALDAVIYLTKERIANHEVEKTVEGEILDSLALHNVCCRRHMLTHVDIE